MDQLGLGCSFRGTNTNQAFSILISPILDCMHPLHARQPAPEHCHPCGPQREAHAVAALQGPRH